MHVPVEDTHKSVTEKGYLYMPAVIDQSELLEFKLLHCKRLKDKEAGASVVIGGARVFVALCPPVAQSNTTVSGGVQIRSSADISSFRKFQGIALKLLSPPDADTAEAGPVTLMLSWPGQVTQKEECRC